MSERRAGLETGNVEADPPEICRRLRQWLCAKHKVPGQGTLRFPDDDLHQTLGLVKLPERTRNFSWANP